MRHCGLVPRDRSPSIASRGIAFIAGVLCCTSLASSQVAYVDADAPEGGDGLSWGTALNDLQDALAGARPGMSLWVAEGMYYPDRGTGDRQVSFRLKDNVAILGGFEGNESNANERDPLAHPTILSGDIGVTDDIEDNSHHVVFSLNTRPSAVLDGFIIENGNAGTEEVFGGGIYNRAGNPTVRNCIIRHNRGYAGAGFFNLWGQRPDFFNVSFIENYATARGGAVYTVDGAPNFKECQFLRNDCFEGGTGIYFVGGFSRVEDCLFDGNTSTEGGSAIYSVGGAPSFFGCDFQNNISGNGGAIHNDSGLPVFENCRFLGNVATGVGGAMYHKFGFPELINCAIRDNTAALAGGAIYNDRGFPEMMNCSISQNSAPDGGAFYSNGVALMSAVNSIIWDNPAANEIVGPSEIGYSCIMGGYPGIGNISDDPLFADAELRLDENSPCVDAGESEILPQRVVTDMEYAHRFVDLPQVADKGSIDVPAVDMGAYEVQSDLILLRSADPLVGGEQNVIELRANSSNGIVAIAVSRRGLGSTWVPQLRLFLEIEQASPVGTPQPLDRYGMSVWNIDIPMSAVGRTLWMQGMHEDGRLTNIARSGVK